MAYILVLSMLDSSISGAPNVIIGVAGDKELLFL